VEYDGYLERVREQAGALRAAAVKAGPEADVPTVPEWNVRRLVRHIARVHNWVVLSLDPEPGGTPPKAERPPEDWETLLTFWDDQVGNLVERMRERGPDAPAWTFGTAVGTTGWWARRQAHETSIHRLDAEHAAHGDAVDHLVFDPEFAADGIDEALTFMITRKPADASGTVLYHAADAGRAWLVTATAGEPPRGAAELDSKIDGEIDSGLDADASVVGTADAVYRAVWRRPSHAVVSGDRTLVAGINIP
jgi:uncharacterized protein (TIGR03083 family)